MKKIKKIIYPISLLGVLIWAYINLYGNFHKIDNDVYRSGQLNSVNMPIYIHTLHLKSILNLRGKSPYAWYLMEKQIAQENNVSLLSFKISSRDYYDFNQTSALVSIIKNAPKPLLIHCLGGADRTSLASALYVYSVKHAPKSIAKEQLSWYYGHVPIIRPHVTAMDKSFENFVHHSQLKNIQE